MNKLLISIILGLFIVVVLIGLYGCQGGNNNLSEMIIKAIDKNAGQSNTCSITMKEITTFEWDKMVIFDTGTSNIEVSKALGVEYKDSVDLMSGMVFVFKNKIVYQIRIPNNPDRPNKFNIVVNSHPGKSSCIAYSPDDAIFEGTKKTVDGQLYYHISPYETK